MKKQSYLIPEKVEVVDAKKPYILQTMTYVNKGRDKEFYYNRSLTNGATFNWS